MAVTVTNPRIILFIVLLPWQWSSGLTRDRQTYISPLTIPSQRTTAYMYEHGTNGAPRTLPSSVAVFGSRVVEPTAGPPCFSPEGLSVPADRLNSEGTRG